MTSNVDRQHLGIPYPQLTPARLGKKVALGGGNPALEYSRDVGRDTVAGFPAFQNTREIRTLRPSRLIPCYSSLNYNSVAS